MTLGLITSSREDKHGVGWHEELVTAFDTLIELLSYLFSSPMNPVKNRASRASHALLSVIICTVLFEYCVY